MLVPCSPAGTWRGVTSRIEPGPARVCSPRPSDILTAVWAPTCDGGLTRHGGLPGVLSADWVTMPVDYPHPLTGQNTHVIIGSTNVGQGLSYTGCFSDADTDPDGNGIRAACEPCDDSDVFFVPSMDKYATTNNNGGPVIVSIDG